MVDIHPEIQTLSISRSFVKSSKWVSRFGHVIVLFYTKELRPHKLYIFISISTQIFRTLYLVAVKRRLHPRISNGRRVDNSAAKELISTKTGWSLMARQ
jgi:hypothetical protein